MIIRQAKPGDEEGIARVHMAGWKISYQDIFGKDYLASLSVEERVKSWGEYLRKNHTDKSMMLAQEKDEIVGFISMCPSREEGSPPDRGEISALYIHPNHQRKGIGEKLLFASFEWFKKNGFKEILVQTLDVSKFKHFYVKQGGVLQSAKTSRTFKDGQTLELVEYRWEL